MGKAEPTAERAKTAAKIEVTFIFSLVKSLAVDIFGRIMGNNCSVFMDVHHSYLDMKNEWARGQHIGRIDPRAAQ